MFGEGTEEYAVVFKCIAMTRGRADTKELGATVHIVATSQDTSINHLYVTRSFKTA